MTAVDEYHAVAQAPQHYGVDKLMAYADAAIAELEGELGKWKADFRAMETAALDHEAELAALKEENNKLKVCANCKHHGSTSQWEYDPACFVGEQPEYTDDSENCIHSPSKWEERTA